MDKTDNYGSALIYYARAHQRQKIKDVLDLLISYSLVQSVAYPATSDLDPNLSALIHSPVISLEHLASLDQTAAELLHKYLSGYAALRRFYDLRDTPADTEKGKTPDLDSRKEAAGKCLLAVISSAADNINGGLFDPTRDSVVQVDGLLALLGEATVFINRKFSPKSPFSPRRSLP